MYLNRPALEPSPSSLLVMGCANHSFRRPTADREARRPATEQGPFSVHFFGMLTFAFDFGGRHFSGLSRVSSYKQVSQETDASLDVFIYNGTLTFPATKHLGRSSLEEFQSWAQVAGFLRDVLSRVEKHWRTITTWVLLESADLAFSLSFTT